MTDRPAGVLRITRQGQAVLGIVDRSQAFHSAQEIHARLRAAGESVGLTTVYRHLALLSGDGQLDSVQTADGELLYRRCLSTRHHHHIVCRQCGYGTEVESRDLEQWLEATAESFGYRDLTHMVEIFGICAHCHTTAP